jgi:hypothetical protein
MKIIVPLLQGILNKKQFFGHLILINNLSENELADRNM